MPIWLRNYTLKQIQDFNKEDIPSSKPKGKDFFDSDGNFIKNPKP